MDGQPVLLLVILGGVNHQVTHILTVGVIFEEFRQWVRSHLGSKAGHLVQYHLCAGMCVGFLESAATYDPIRITASALVGAVLMAFFVALLERIFNEALTLGAAQGPCHCRVPPGRGSQGASRQQRRSEGE